MAFASISASAVGNTLQELLVAPDIQAGDEPSYQLCKALYLYHALGQKMVEAPTRLAQSQKREISVPGAPGDHLVKAFESKWKELGVDKVIFNAMRQSRMYGVSTLALFAMGRDGKVTPPETPLELEKLRDQVVAFNVYDPLNTAGSLVLNQNPLSADFQKAEGFATCGQRFHPSRGVTVMNEEPIYLAYTTSAFGFVGRSVYQRALLPLKSFVQTMRTDDLISLKAGVIIAKIKQAGAIINERMQRMFGLKRDVVREAVLGNVISISSADNESIETLNMQNLDGAYGMARTNILKNIATAADMPAQLIENETMVSGFGEGTEDAKNIAKYVDRHREEMEPLYSWFDKIVMYLAWTPEFFETLQDMFPDAYGASNFEAEFTRWRNSFTSKWPSLLVEPDSEKAKAAKVKLEGVISALQNLGPMLDPFGKAKLVQWAVDEINSIDFLFSSRFELDFDALLSWTEEQMEKMEKLEAQAPQGGGDDELTKPRPALTSV